MGTGDGNSPVAFNYLMIGAERSFVFVVRSFTVANWEALMGIRLTVSSSEYSSASGCGWGSLEKPLSLLLCREALAIPFREVFGLLADCGLLKFMVAEGVFRFSSIGAPPDEEKLLDCGIPCGLL